MSKAEPKAKRRRSPNYPAIDLSSAIERVARIYSEDGRAGAPVAIAVKRIGYSSAHGQAMTVISALQKYGLTENRNGRIVPTTRAIDMIEFKRGQPRFDIAAREAALQPAIYREICEHYEALGGLPSDESLKPELITDKGFNPRAVMGFLADMRSTLEFAGLLRGNVLSLSTDGAAAGIAPQNGTEMPLAPDIPSIPSLAADALMAMPNASTTFSLDEGMASITWPSDMGADSFRDFEAWMHVVLQRVARSAGAADYYQAKKTDKK